LRRAQRQEADAKLACRQEFRVNVSRREEHCGMKAVLFSTSGTSGSTMCRPLPYGDPPGLPLLLPTKASELEV
jgi:hypothetical protein